MPQRLQRKLALVTAAGQGIGRAIGEAFIAEGATVVATDVEEIKLDGLKSAKRLKLDVLSTAAVETLARTITSEFGQVDILVNCAGYVHNGTILDCAERDWDFSFDLNVKSMHRTIKAFLPGMLEKNAGAIVNIASAVSSIRGVPDRYVYGATKAAVIGLTKAVAADFIKQGIRANAILPRHYQSLPPSRAASRNGHWRQANPSLRSSVPLWNANPWVGLAEPRKSRPSPCFSRRTRQVTSPDKRISSTAEWRFEVFSPANNEGFPVPGLWNHLHCSPVVARLLHCGIFG